MKISEGLYRDTDTHAPRGILDGGGKATRIFQDMHVFNKWIYVYLYKNILTFIFVICILFIKNLKQILYIK